MDLTFPKSRRLRRTAEFRRVYDARRSASDPRITLYALPNDLGHPRLGVSASRKLGNAVARNRWKRLLREAFRLLQHELPAADFVIVPRPGAEPQLAELSESLRALAKRCT